MSCASLGRVDPDDLWQLQTEHVSTEGLLPEFLPGFCVTQNAWGSISPSLCGSFPEYSPVLRDCFAIDRLTRPLPLCRTCFGDSGRRLGKIHCKQCGKSPCELWRIIARTEGGVVVRDSLSNGCMGNNCCVFANSNFCMPHAGCPPTTALKT